MTVMRQRISPATIMLVIPNLTYGGAQSACNALARGLSELGHRCHIVVFENRIDYALPKGVALSCVRNILTQRGPVRYAAFIETCFKLSAEIKKIGSEAVISYLTEANLRTLGAVQLIGRRRRPRVIVTEHAPLRRRARVYGNRAVIAMSRLLYPAADLIVSVSDGLRKEICRTISVPSSKVQVIYNPLPLEEIRDRAKEDPEHEWFGSDVPIIITVGRLEKEKNHTLLLRAFRSVKNELHAHLVIIGDGALLPALKEEVLRLGLSEDVLFLGFQRNPFKYIARSAVFVLSSSFEGFGNVLLEAMACNVPVISTDCECGPREIIAHQKTGLLVPPDNEEALAKSILALMRDPQLRESLKMNAHQTLYRYDYRQIASAFLNAMNNMKEN